MEILFLKALVNFLKAKTGIAILYQILIFIFIILWILILFFGTAIPWGIWCVARIIAAFIERLGSGIKQKLFG